MPSFKTQQEVPCFIVCLTKFLVLAPCGVLAYSWMWIADLIAFSSKMCHQNCVDCDGQVSLGQAEMCWYHRARFVQTIQSMLSAYSTTSHHVHLCKKRKGAMSKVNRQHNAKEWKFCIFLLKERCTPPGQAAVPEEMSQCTPLCTWYWWKHDLAKK